MNIGSSLKKLRKDKGMRQKEFATQCCITQTYVSNIEKGIKKPSLPVLEKMAGVLGIPLPVLFWYSVTEIDVKTEKLTAYRIIRPAMDALIQEIFEIKPYSFAQVELNKCDHSRLRGESGNDFVVCLDCGKEINEPLK